MNRVYLFLRWFFGLGPPDPPRYARVNLEDWRALSPGEARVLEDTEGNQWVLMHLDDFDHIVGTANLERRRIPTIASKP